MVSGKWRMGSVDELHNRFLNLFNFVVVVDVVVVAIVIVIKCLKKIILLKLQITRT